MNDYRQLSAESWHNFHFLPYFKSKTIEQIFTKFLHDVDGLVF